MARESRIRFNRPNKAAKAARFICERSESACIVEVQQSSKSTEEQGRCTINIGLWILPIVDEMGGPLELSAATATDCPWWVRAGQLDGVSEERWWIFGSGSEAAGASAEMWTSFVEPALRMMLPLLELNALNEACLEGGLPWLDVIHRWTFVLILARRSHDRDAIRRATDELQVLAQRDTLPASTRRLLLDISVG